MDNQSEFVNDDKKLLSQVDRVLTERRSLGLENLVGGLEAVIINTALKDFEAAVHELLDFTGLSFVEGWESPWGPGCRLVAAGSADFLIQARKNQANPFAAYNVGPKASSLPQARLETFVFEVFDMAAYLTGQSKRGTKFLTAEPIKGDNYLFIQTEPSAYTGNSVGLIQWTGERRNFSAPGKESSTFRPVKPDRAYLKNIGPLDHTATRVRAEERDAAILEFIGLTNYDFSMAIYVDSLNSITSVARLSPDDYAAVFTSGITPFADLATSGPTEKFIHNYGTRVHHMAFRTEEIHRTFAGLKADGLDFLVELVGGEEDGLWQTFSQQSPTTILVNEYINRYPGFDGFFSRRNVHLLTEATDKQ